MLECEVLGAAVTEAALPEEVGSVIGIPLDGSVEKNQHV